MRGSGGVAAKCHNSFLSGELLDATVQVASTTPLKGFYVVFQGRPSKSTHLRINHNNSNITLIATLGTQSP